jgi:hypothetical protein
MRGLTVTQHFKATPTLGIGEHKAITPGLSLI